MKGLLKQRIFLLKKKQDKGFDLFNTQVQLLTRAFMYIDILIIDLKLPSITQQKNQQDIFFERYIDLKITQVTHPIITYTNG